MKGGGRALPRTWSPVDVAEITAVSQSDMRSGRFHHKAKLQRISFDFCTSEESFRSLKVRKFGEQRDSDFSAWIKYLDNPGPPFLLFAYQVARAVAFFASGSATRQSSRQQPIMPGTVSLTDIDLAQLIIKMVDCCRKPLAERPLFLTWVWYPLWLWNQGQKHSSPPGIANMPPKLFGSFTT